MKIKAILRGNRLEFSEVVVIKKPEIEVEIEIKDEDIELLTEENLTKMTLHELAKVIWRGRLVDQRDYKEIVGDALSAHYRGEL